MTSTITTVVAHDAAREGVRKKGEAVAAASCEHEGHDSTATYV